MKKPGSKTEKSDKRELILETAITLFGQKGYEGTSIRDISSRAGVNLAMINYYFGSKEGLFEQMILEKAAHLKIRLQNLISNRQMRPDEKINEVIEGYVDRLFTHRGFSLAMIQELSKQQRLPLHESISSVFMENMELIRTIIQEGIRKKQFRKVDVDLTISTIIGTIWNLIINEIMVKKLLGAQIDENPYELPAFRRRVIRHIKDLVAVHLANT